MRRERSRHPGHPEDPLVPSRACLDVGDGRREVVVASDSRRRAGLSQGTLLVSVIAARADAMIAHATAPITAMIPKTIRCRTVIGERSTIATGGKSSSVRIKLTSVSCSAMCFVTLKPYDDCEAPAECLQYRARTASMVSASAGLLSSR